MILFRNFMLFMIFYGFLIFMFGAMFLMISEVAKIVIWTILFWSGMYGVTYYTNMMILKLFSKRLKDAERLRPSLASSDLSH